MKQGALHLAAQAGDAAAILRLLDSGADPNEKGDGGERPLMRAAANGAAAAVAVLLDRGAEVNAVTDAGNTALMFAAARGQLDALRMLIERGANTTHKNKYGLGASDWAQWSNRAAEILPLLDTPPVSA
jgi:ankyrin repeat protein